MWDTNIGKKRAGFYVIGSSDVPLYLYRLGSEWALFDGGLTGMGPMVHQQLKETIGDPANLRYWFITHAHYDHYGLLPYLSKYLNHTQIIISTEGARTLNSKRAREVAASLNAGIATAWDYETDLTQLTEIFNHNIVGSLPITTVVHGQQIHLDTGVCVTAIATPGHSRCSFSYLIEPDGVLITADALGEIIAGNEFLPLLFDSYQDYVTSLDKLSELSPATIGMGHHGVLSGDLALSAAKDARICLDDFTTEVLEEKAGCGNTDQLAETLTQKHWDRSSRFITRDIHNKSMLRMIELIIDAKENGNG